jgi:hypothetical protein
MAYGYKLTVSGGSTNAWAKGGEGKVKRVNTTCSTAFCTNQAVRAGLCKHSGLRFDFHTNASSWGGLCFKHGAEGHCTVPGCSTNALKRGGLC